MSTIILGRMSSAASRPTDVTALEEAGDTKHWLEALAAVIPGEALAAYTGIIAFFTLKESDGTSSLSHDGLVQVLSAVIFLAIPIAYAAAGGEIGGKPHVVRWVAAMVAFLAWLWLLPLSVWDTFAFSQDLDTAERGATGIAAAFVILAVATWLFRRWPIAKAPPPPPPPE